MRGQATPTTPAKSVGLNVFHGVRAPVWTSRRETGHEVSPRRPISNVFPLLVQRKGVAAKNPGATYSAARPGPTYHRANPHSLNPVPNERQTLPLSRD